MNIFSKKKGKCTTCRFNMRHEFYGCNVGSHYAETKGINVTCHEGELWEEAVIAPITIDFGTHKTVFDKLNPQHIRLFERFYGLKNGINLK